jgi:hypothetical protein
MGCSARCYYRYATRRLSVPIAFVFALCDVLDVMDEEFMDEAGFFRLDETSAALRSAEAIELEQNADGAFRYRTRPAHPAPGGA